MLATPTDGSLSKDEVGRRELDVSSSVQLGKELEGLQCSWDGQSMLPLMKKSPALLEGHLNDVCLEGGKGGAEDWCNVATHAAEGIRMAQNPWPYPDLNTTILHSKQFNLHVQWHFATGPFSRSQPRD